MLPTATESGVKITVLPPTILAQMICDCTVLRPDIGGFQLESTLRSRYNQSVCKVQGAQSRGEVRARKALEIYRQVDRLFGPPIIVRAHNAYH